MDNGWVYLRAWRWMCGEEVDEVCGRGGGGGEEGYLRGEFGDGKVVDCGLRCSGKVTSEWEAIPRYTALIFPKE